MFWYGVDQRLDDIVDSSETCAIRFKASRPQYLLFGLCQMPFVVHSTVLFYPWNTDIFTFTAHQTRHYLIKRQNKAAAQSLDCLFGFLVVLSNRFPCRIETFIVLCCFKECYSDGYLCENRLRMQKKEFSEGELLS